MISKNSIFEKMFIFNNYPSPSLFSQKHFRISYSLLPAIRGLIENTGRDILNIISIACGTALELSTLELLARSRGIKINYCGCDLDKTDLSFNVRMLQKTAPRIKQMYIHSNIAKRPPVLMMADAHCILWRHPEFLSDHFEVSLTLILDMSQILLNILAFKRIDAPLLITTYDPHEMMIILELLNQFCDEGLAYKLSIDMHEGRASWRNPLVDPEDTDPLFNVNHHDQCQLLVTGGYLKRIESGPDVFIQAIAKAFQNILRKIQPEDSDELRKLFQELETPDVEQFRNTTAYLNDLIRMNSDPFIKREQMCAVLVDLYEQPQKEPAETMCQSL